MPAMLLISQLLVPLLILTDLTSQEVCGFWFTDNSLNYRPAQEVQDSGLKNEATNQLEVAQQQVTSDNSAEKQTAAWVSPLRPVQAQAGCSCSSDLIQNYTSSFLGRWLNSQNVTNQLRAALLNSSLSTGSSNINRPATHLARFTEQVAASSHNGSRNNQYLGSAWVRSRSHNSNSSSQLRLSSSRQQRQSNMSGTSVSPALPAPGPPGPKGEIGPRGERGLPGLLRVRYRDALFDLATSSSNLSLSKDQRDEALRQNSNNQPELPGLAFVESEQMLVVLSASGWRPVQLLPAIHDFRRAIAKFSLSSASERTKLMQTAGTSNRLNKHSSTHSKSSAARRPEATQITHKPTRLDNDILTKSFINDQVYEDNNDIDDVGDEDNEVDFSLSRSKKVNKIKINPPGELIDDDDDDEDDDEDEDDFESEEEDEEEEADAAANANSIGIENVNEQENSSKRTKQLISSRSAVSAPLPNAELATEARESLPGDELPMAVAAPVQSQSDKEQQQHDSNGMRLRVAALNEPFSGNVHGIRGADFECRRNAAKANIKGSFRAFLASGFQNLNEVVRYNVLKYPLVNLRGETLANSWHDFFKQPAHMLNPLSRIYSFDRRHVASDSNWPNKLVWHGASNKFGHRDSIHNCDGWHSDSLNRFGFASPLHNHRNFNSTNKKSKHTKRSSSSFNENQLAESSRRQQHKPFVLESIDKYPCRMPLIMLCIETIGQHQQSTLDKPNGGPIADRGTGDIENSIS